MGLALGVAVAWLGSGEAAAGEDDDRQRALELGAVGARRLRAGRAERAIEALESAAALWPESGVLQLDLARAYGAAGRWDDAAIAAERAAAAGAPQRVAAGLLAVAQAHLNHPAAARDAAAQAGRAVGTRLGAALGDPAAVRRLASGPVTPTGAGALGRYVLAVRALRQGRDGAARDLARRAVRIAESATDSIRPAGAQPGSDTVDRVLRASRALLDRLDRRPWLDWGGRAAVRGGVHHRPALDAGPGRGFGSVEADVGARAQVGPVQAWLRGRGLLRQLTGPAAQLTDRWIGAAIHLGFGLPIGGPASGIRVTVDSRVTVLSADFEPRIASRVEVGPSLWFPVGRGWNLRLGAYGVRLDVGRRFSPEADTDPANRDSFGQRVALSAIRTGPEMQVQLHGWFSNDESEGEVFDGLGGGFGATLARRLPTGVWVWITGRARVQDFGPTLVPAFVGTGRRVTELRLFHQVGLEVPLGDPWFVELRGSVLTNRSDGEGAYDDARGQLGVGLRW
jgi:hypothetical protein